jgi:hypothetical protein
MGKRKGVGFTHGPLLLESAVGGTCEGRERVLFSMTRLKVSETPPSVGLTQGT